MLPGLLGNFKRGMRYIYKSSHINSLYLHLDYIINLNSRGGNEVYRKERDNKGDVSSKRLHCLFIL